jgi:hypothetical protein
MRYLSNIPSESEVESAGDEVDKPGNLELEVSSDSEGLVSRVFSSGFLDS